jgi:hypothetical protein
VHGLEDRYRSQIDFIYLNIDNRDTLPVRERFGIVQRSHYVLIDAQGNIVRRWIGFLNAAEVEAAIFELLARDTS